MKKLLTLLSLIPILYILFWLLPVVFRFVEFLFILDNTDFGIPWWLDLLIDSIAGGIAFVLTKSICGVFPIQDKKSKDTIGNIISIIIGVAIALIVQLFMQYWIVIVSIIGAIIVGFIIYVVVSNYKKKTIKPNESQLKDNK